MPRRATIATVLVVATLLVAAIATLRFAAVSWRAQRPADPRAALIAAAATLAAAPGDAAAAWDRACALEALGLTRTAASAFEVVATSDGGRGPAARTRARRLRDLDRGRDAARRGADAATRATTAMRCRGADTRLGQASRALAAGDLLSATREAGAAFDDGRASGCDPGDIPRRALLLLAEAARARQEPALALAYVDEARIDLVTP